jgi:Holliday junction resolvase RusA-like endonuclease
MVLELPAIYHINQRLRDNFWDGARLPQLRGNLEVGPVVSDAMQFFVAGEPVPQGSSRAFVVKGRAVITHANKGTDGWRQRIATEAQKAAAEHGWTWEDDKDVGYEIIGTFRFTKPKSAPKKRKLNTRKPDLDKLVRALNDAITGILIPDDSQIVRINIGKEYAEEGQGPGIWVKIQKRMG